MPYIRQTERLKYDTKIDELVNILVNDTARYNTTSVYPGHLNYIITKLILRAYEGAANLDGFTLGYSDYNEIIGMLECCKLEFYRKIVGPYEQRKITENGDV